MTNNIKITDMRVTKADSAFLIDDGTTSILYDTGFAFTGYALAEKIKAYLNGRSLDYIFLTHSHYDHALGSAYVSEVFPKARVVAGEYAARIFEKPSAKAVMRGLDKKFAEKCGIPDYEDRIDSLHVDIAVCDGQIIDAGSMQFEVLSLPGHTRCSVAYYLKKEKLLLSCETLGVYAGEGMVVPSYLVGYNMTLDSIRKASEYEIDGILIPHYGVLDKKSATLYLETAYKSAKQTATEIIELLKKGTTKPQIIEFFKQKFYNDYVKEIYPIDAMELNTSITIDLLEKEMITVL